MKRKVAPLQRIALAGGLSVALISPVLAAEVDGNRLNAAEKEPGNWMTYHGTYKSWHYSPLDQINTGNVTQLKEAWSHVASRANRGLQGFPLAIDGVLYYSSPYDQVYALDGATGQILWTYKQKLNEDLVARQTHSPYNRGIAAGYGNIYIGTLDGKLAAIDAKTGQLKWETKLIDSEKLTVGFTGAPLLVKDKVIIGSQGGEWPYRGPMFGVDAKTGKEVWHFFTVGGNEDNADARNTWGKDSWRVGGGGGWMVGAYDPETNTVWWGTANPAPLYDWAGDKWKTEGPRPGINLYTTSVILLDPDTGKLKGYHQELPHDAWDFDSAVGEFMFLERDGKKYVVHPNKGGFVFVYDRNGKLQNVYRGVDNINFVKDIDPKTGELIGRRDMAEGKHTNLCPAIAGGYSWPSGAYSPKTNLFYRVGFEWCMDLDIVKTEPITEPVAQLYIGANFTMHGPGDKQAYGHIRGRDPLTGQVKFEIPYPKAPPHASLLVTGGNILFVPEADGMLVAYDATNGKKLWSHNNGQGHDGGIITYTAKGKQYVAVMTGWGSLVSDGYGDLWGEPWKTMPKDSGVLKVFALP
ncbi:MAG TPA: PQQ-binding-like beta-propeller repeat protein [Burkholderiales bacterium]|nr:PQQ-binding-like beta-propeller repeat protein [Burkholderiales bacterium]